MKRRFVTVLAVLTALFSCTDNYKVSVSVECPDLEDSTEIFLSRLAINRLEIIDTFQVHSGRCDLRIDYDQKNPEFMYLSTPEDIIASFVAVAGEKVTVSQKSSDGYTVYGSQETQLMQQVLQLQRRFEHQSDSLSKLYVQSSIQGEKEKTAALNREISRLYMNYKRNSIDYIMNHTSSITSIPVLYGKVFGDHPLFGTASDIIYFKTVLQNLKESYPSSPYVRFLEYEIQKTEDAGKITEHLKKMTELSFPEISLYDIDGRLRKLSELTGKVIILSFWSAEKDAMKMYNLELSKIYDRYNASGLEIYQVSPDLDKNLWANVVKNQDLPWISVNDTNGENSLALASYNVQRIPSLFIIDRSGAIVARDVFRISDLERIIKILL